MRDAEHSQIIASGDRSVAADHISGSIATGDNATVVTGDLVQIRGETVNINLPNGPLACSAYLEQVRQVAPLKLRDRDRELADLAEFCIDREVGSYQWWQAAAWSGKSALMSWFVLHPPPGVQVVSFFVTARYAGQNDRIAFTDVVLEQLAELLGQSMPAYLPEATRDSHFLMMLADGAKACQLKGQRLVLVVDGLDEDRGVVAGPGGHSIAALLPVRPAAGLRIVVAGRPDPSIPSDVADNHPLRDPGVVRVLDRSPWAEVVRADMQRELGRLLHGTRLEMDLLGLVTAAGGGLSAPDLAELTSQPEYEIEENLHAVVGRTFTSHAPRLDPEAESPVYVLGHEELQAASKDFLGNARLTDYRSRLHAWADGYRNQHWPSGTPEYLLRGYFRMSYDSQDISRVVSLATDQERHDRMLDVTGGDTATLTEITDAQDFLLSLNQPDMAAVIRLAAHRISIVERNASIPTRLPAVWALIGNPARAGALARAITNPGRRTEALFRLIKTTMHVNDASQFWRLVEESKESVRTIPSLDQRELAFTRLVELMAAAGHLAEAEQVISLVRNRGLRIEALARLANMAAVDGNLVQAEVLARRAENMASRSRDPDIKAHALTSLTEVATAAGNHSQVRRLTRKALRAVRAVSKPVDQAQILTRLVNTAVAAGDLEHAVLIAEEITDQNKHEDALVSLAIAFGHASEGGRALAITRKITDRGKREDALIGLVGAFASADELEQAESLISTLRLRRRTEAQAAFAIARMSAGDFERTETTAFEIPRQGLRGQVLAALARTAATGGDLERAETAAKAINNISTRVTAVASVAEAAARKGDLRRARELVALAEESARAVTNLDEQARILAELAQPIARAGGVERAQRLAHSIDSPRRRSEALARLAQTAAEDGDLSLASTLARESEDAARVIIDLDRRAQMLIALVSATAIAGDHQRAGVLAKQAEKLANVAGSRTQLLAELAEVVARSISYEYASDLARSVTNTARKSEVLTRLVEIASAVGDFGQARELAKQAEKAATAITISGRRAQVTAGLVKAVAAAGYFDWADDLTRSISDPDRLAEAQITLVNAIGSAGDFQRALGLVRVIDSISRQGEALVCLVEAASKANDHERFSALSLRAEKLILRITNPRKRAQLLVILIKSVAAAGEFDRAERLTQQISFREKRAEALTELAGAAAANEETQRFLVLARRAELSIRRTSKGWKSILLAELVKAVATAGEFDWADKLAREITVPDRRAKALMDLAEEVEATGGLQRARDLAKQAEEIVFTIRKPEWQAQTLTEFAMRVKSDRALPLLARALTLGNWAPTLEIVSSVHPAAIIEAADEYLNGISISG